MLYPHPTKYIYLKLSCLIFTVCISLLINSQTSMASAGRTLIVYNNTNATISVEIGGNIIDVPPLSKKSIVDLLHRGRNRVDYIAKCNHKLSFHKILWVSGQEKRTQSMELFSGNFGKSAMYDKPGCGAYYGDEAEGVRPTSWKECETSKFGKFCGTWTFNHKNKTGKAGWSNGATADLVIETFNQSNVIIKRTDKSGLRATYKGSITGKSVKGSFYFYLPDKKKPGSHSGKWEASW